MTARFLPFLTFSRAALFFLARPTAILLDWWLGVEGITYLHERDVRSLVGRAAANGGDIGKLEATGVQNFLDLDDLPVTEEGDIISLPLARLWEPQTRIKSLSITSSSGRSCTTFRHLVNAARLLVECGKNCLPIFAVLSANLRLIGDPESDPVPCCSSSGQVCSNVRNWHF